MLVLGYTPGWQGREAVGLDCTLAVFDEDVAVHKSAVRAAGRLVRPALRFNHDLMMRSGERGLRKFLTAPADSKR